MTQQLVRSSLMGEFLMNAQGEDVVAGVRTPQTIDQLKEVMPEVYEQFVEVSAILWKTTIEICRIWSSPLRTESCTCYRPEMVRELQRLH